MYQAGIFPNQPPSFSLVGTVGENSQSTFGPYTSGTTLRIDGGAGQTLYSVGVAPVVLEKKVSPTQGDPVAVNATGAVSAAAMQGGIVTSTTAAAVAGTIPAGSVMDLAVQMAVGDSFDWSVINTGPNTFTVTAAAGHTIVGAGAVATATSGLFRTRKTAADTFISYRIA
ncbi:hypothetical protein D9M71_277200 [compost metagenome]